MEEEVTDRVKLAVLKKDELMRNLDSLKAQSSSLLEVSVRWKDIESYFDSTFKLIEKKTQEGVDAIRVREEEGKVVAEKRAEEIRVREERVGVLRSAIFGNIYEERKRLAEMEREIEERGKRVELAEKEAEVLKKSVEEGATRLEDERKRLEKEIEDMRNVVEWRGKRLDQRKKEIDATLKEVEGRESEIEVEKKMAESRSAELDMKEKKLCDMERDVAGISAELEVKRNENIALQQEVLLLTQKLDVRKTNSSNFIGKSRGGERAEQLSSIQKLHHDSQLHESVGITDAYCSSTLNDFDRNELVYGTASDADQLNAAEFPSTNNAAKLSVIEYQSASIAAGSSCVDTALDGRTLQMYFNDLSSNVESWQDEILPVLLKLSDPTKVVLDAMVGFYPPHQIIDGKEFEASVVRRTCLCLLRNLSNLLAGVNATVRDEALRLAFEWKEKMRITDQLEVTGFMDLVLTYGLDKEFSGLKLLNLSKIVSAELPPLKLLRDLGCAGSISSSDIAPNKTNSEVTNRKTSGIGYVKSLIQMNKRLQALEYICEFDLEDEFPIHHIVDTHINYLKQTSAIILEEEGNSTATQMKAMEFEICCVKDLIKCIESLRLQDRYSPANLKEGIAQLERQKHLKKHAAACLNFNPPVGHSTNGQPLKRRDCMRPGTDNRICSQK